MIAKLSFGVIRAVPFYYPKTLVKTMHFQSTVGESGSPFSSLSG